MISLFNKKEIQRGNVSQIKRLAQETVTLARVWAVMFACHLIKTSPQSLDYDQVHLLYYK
jgi:hypothetical protein